MEAKCVKSFAEDGTEYWSEGSYYLVLRSDEEGYTMRHNYGVGFVYVEDFTLHFEMEEDAVPTPRP